tara:strand:+ start:108 stop:1118 length:1011 start_codon:yes stop_codon:yes gene_type:complete
MPIHILWGDDVAAIERESEKLIKQIITPEWASINLSRLDGDDPNHISQGLNEIRTEPFGNGGRLVIIKKSPFCNNCNNEVALLFEEAISLIPENTHLILQSSIKPDGRLRTTKTLKKLVKDNLVEEKIFLLPAIWDGPGQIALVERIAEELHLEIDPEAKSFLIEALGCDSSRIYSELQKVSLNANTSKIDIQTNYQKINLKIVSELIEGITTNSLEIGNYLLKDKIGDAIYRLDALIDSGEPPLRILSTLTGQIRGWLWVSLLQLEGENDVNIIAKAAGISNPKRIYIMRKQIQGENPEKFLKLLKSLLEIEASLKKGASAKDAFKDGLINQKII